MDAARLPEIFDFEGLVVRCFPAECATEFPHLPQSERRATPAVVRRLFSAAAKYTAENSTSECLICGAPAPLAGRIIIAVEMSRGGKQNLGYICADCGVL